MAEKLEDWEVERALTMACSDAIDVMNEERCIEILIESMDVKSQREALSRIVGEMEEPDDEY